MTDLTRDNLLLSRPKTGANSGLNDFALECKIGPERIADLVRESLAPNTRAAYLADLAHFEEWGGCIPASPESVASYVAAHSEILSIATLRRRMAALAKVHCSHGLASPIRSELVRSVLRGLKRVKSAAQRQAKPLLKEDLISTLDAIGDGPKGLRDRALLLVGFAGGFRRSELVSLTHADVERVRQGLVLTIRRSKTDQNGEGRKIGIPIARGRWCPVLALEAWLAALRTTEGALFRPVGRGGRIGAERLSGEAISLVVKERLRAAGIDPSGYSGHSLRAGLATSAAQAGVPSWKIRQQTGHASEAMLSRYIREGELFRSNAAGVLL